MQLRPALVIAIFLMANFAIQPARADGDSAQALSERLRSAIKAQDLKAASELVDWGQAPAPAYRMFKMSILDCFSPAECSVKVAALSDEEKKARDDYTFVIPPEGALTIIPKGSSSGLSLPFAKIGDHYKIVIGQQSEAGYEQIKAIADARKIAQELDPDLLSSGTPLPADGGDPARTFREYVSAVSRGDSDYLAQHGSAGDRYYFGKAYAANSAKRAVTVELAIMENIPNPVIKAGFVNGDRALLLVNGQSSQGWNSEGAVTLQRKNGLWEIEDKRFISYPAKK